MVCPHNKSSFNSIIKNEYVNKIKLYSSLLAGDTTKSLLHFRTMYDIHLISSTHDKKFANLFTYSFLIMLLKDDLFGFLSWVEDIWWISYIVRECKWLFVVSPAKNDE